MIGPVPSWRSIWLAIPTRPRRVALLAVVAVAVAVGGWKYTHPITGTMTARIVLDGPVCRVPSHQPVCRKIAYEGRITLHLEPGTYALDFAVDLPYAVLLPDFGYKNDGAFTIHAHQTTRLGTVEPGKVWVITED